MEYIFSDKVQTLKGSAIREIFKLVGDPTVISFAGGMPAPEMFPAKELSVIAKDILENNPTLALQYSVTEGYAPLIEIVKQRLEKGNNIKNFDDLIIVSGGQQGIDLATKVLINEGDTVICEEPSFIGGLNCFRSYNAKLKGVPLEMDGMNIDILEKIIKEDKRVKIIYTIPTFQNPSGITMSLEKRKRLVEIAKKNNIIIIEDNPYGELRFHGDEIQTIKSLDDSGSVIYIGSFSKTLSPGLRLGFVSAPAQIIEKMVVCKQVTDVHTPIFVQLLATEYLKKHSIDDHIIKIRELYGKRCDFMLQCIEKYFPKNISHTNPQGGLFIWCNMENGADSVSVVKKCAEKKVVFVPGNTFMTDIEAPSSSFRLNFSNMQENKIAEGIEILGKALYELA